MARWTLYHMECHSHWNSCGLILKLPILLRWLGSWSSCHTEGGQIIGKYQQLSFFPLASESFGPINQVGCDFFLSSLGRRRWPSRIFLPFAASFHFYSALQFSLLLQLIWKRAGTIFDQPALRVSFFPLISNVLGNEVSRAIKKWYNNKQKHLFGVITP